MGSMHAAAPGSGGGGACGSNHPASRRGCMHGAPPQRAQLPPAHLATPRRGWGRRRRAGRAGRGARAPAACAPPPPPGPSPPALERGADGRPRRTASGVRLWWRQCVNEQTVRRGGCSDSAPNASQQADPPSITPAGTACSPSALNFWPPRVAATGCAADRDAKHGSPGAGRVALPPAAAAGRSSGRPAGRRCGCRPGVVALPSSSHTPAGGAAAPGWLWSRGWGAGGPSIECGMAAAPRRACDGLLTAAAIPWCSARLRLRSQGVCFVPRTPPGALEALWSCAVVVDVEQSAMGRHACPMCPRRCAATLAAHSQLRDGEVLAALHSGHSPASQEGTFTGCCVCTRIKLHARIIRAKAEKGATARSKVGKKQRGHEQQRALSRRLRCAENGGKKSVSRGAGSHLRRAPGRRCCTAHRFVLRPRRRQAGL